MKKPSKKPIVFKSFQGMLVQTLLDAEIWAKKFRGSNLDHALHKAIEDGWIFVMPKGLKFAYCRGTGPIGLERVRLGHHEQRQKDSDMPDWNSPRLLIAEYRITLFDPEEERDIRVLAEIPIPSRFTNFFVERSEGIAHSPTLTKLEFVYKVDELRIWLREVQAEKYGKAQRECNDAIRDLKKRLEEIRGMSSGDISVPYQSAFD